MTMKKTRTWEEQRNWLQTTFNTTVTTRWNGPEEFVSTLENVASAEGSNTRPLTGNGTTGEDSVQHLFHMVTAYHTGIRQLVFGTDNQRAIVDPDTLRLSGKPYLSRYAATPVAAAN